MIPIVGYLIWAVAGTLILSMKSDSEGQRSSEKPSPEKDVCSSPPVSLEIHDLTESELRHSPGSGVTQFCRRLSHSLASRPSLSHFSFPNKCSEKEKRDASFLSEVGKQWFALNQPSMGILAFCKATESNPNFDSHKKLGQLLLDDVDPPLPNVAIEAFQTARSLDPNNKSSYLGLGWAYYAKANNVFKDLKLRFPGGLKKEDTPSEILKILADLNSSIYWSNQALDKFKLGEDPGVLFNNLGKTCSLWGDLENYRKANLKALEYYRRALFHFGEATDSYPSRSEKYFRAKYAIATVMRDVLSLEESTLSPAQVAQRRQEIISLLSEILNSSNFALQKDPSISLEFAAVLSEAGKYKEAIERYQKTILFAKAAQDKTIETEALLQLTRLLSYISQKKDKTDEDLFTLFSVYEKAKDFYSTDHPEKAEALAQLGALSLQIKKPFAEAKSFYEESSAMYLRLISIEQKAPKTYTPLTLIDLKNRRSTVLIALGDAYMMKFRNMDHDEADDVVLGQVLNSAYRFYTEAKNPARLQEKIDPNLTFRPDLDRKMVECKQLREELGIGTNFVRDESISPPSVTPSSPSPSPSDPSSGSPPEGN